MFWSMAGLTRQVWSMHHFFIPLSIKILGDFMLKKIISSLMTLLAALSFSELVIQPFS